MREFLKSLSINTLGFAAIVACLIVIVVSDPPKSLCDAEINNFRMGLVGLMYPSPKSSRPPSLPADRDLCRDRNSPGACVELFSGLRKFLSVTSAVSEQCQSQLGELPEFQAVLIKSIDLLVMLAWGPTAPPASVALKNGWLNSSDVFLFCQLKNRAGLIYGEKRWEVFR